MIRLITVWYSRAIMREGLTSYPEVVRRVLGRWAEVLLQLAVVTFAVGALQIMLAHSQMHHLFLSYFIN